MTEAEAETVAVPSEVTCPICHASYATMDRQIYRSQLLCWRCAGQAYYLEALSIAMHKAEIQPRYEHVRAVVLRNEVYRRVIQEVYHGMAAAASYADVPL